MRISLIILMSLFATPALAATEEKFNLKVLDTFQGPTAFRSINVYDIRANKADVGYLRTGALNRKNILITPEGFDVVLKEFGRKLMQQATPVENNELLIVVRDFSLADRPNGGEMGTFYARMDFYLGIDDRYQLLMKVDSFYETSSSWDVTENIRKLAARKTGTWLMRAAAGNRTLERSDVLSMDQLKATYESEKAGFPVYNESAKVGVYYTKEQFINNQPQDTSFVQKDYSIEGGKLSYFYEKVDGKKKGRSFDKIDCFAIFNGQKWYKRTANGMIEMKFLQGDFYFLEMGYGVKTTDEIAVMFGLVGALIASGTSGKGKALYYMRLNPVTGTGICTERR